MRTAGSPYSVRRGARASPRERFRGDQGPGGEVRVHQDSIQGVAAEAALEGEVVGSGGAGLVSPRDDAGMLRRPFRTLSVLRTVRTRRPRTPARRPGSFRWSLARVSCRDGRRCLRPEVLRPRHADCGQSPLQSSSRRGCRGVMPVFGAARGSGKCRGYDKAAAQDAGQDASDSQCVEDHACISRLVEQGRWCGAYPRAALMGVFRGVCLWSGSIFRMGRCISNDFFANGCNEL